MQSFQQRVNHYPVLIIFAACFWLLLLSSQVWAANYTPISAGNADQLEQVKTFYGSSYYVRSLDFSSDGQFLAFSSDYSNRNNIDIVRLSTLTKESTINTDHQGYIEDVAFSPDGSCIASISDDSKVKIWNSADGQLRNNLEGHKGLGLCVGFSPDGQTLASGGFTWGSGMESGPAAIIWDPVHGTMRQALSDYPEWYEPWCWSVAFSPNGQILATGADAVYLWNPVDGSFLRTLGTPNIDYNWNSAVRCLAFSADGTKLAACSQPDKSLMVYNVADASLVLNIPTGHSDLITGVAFSPDGSVLASASTDGSIKIWKTTDGNLLKTLSHRDISCIAFSPDGTYLTSGSLTGGTVCLWAAPPAISFPDLNLEAAVREAINKPEGTIAESDLENLNELNIYGREIANLEGIQHIKNLRGLYAWNNPLTSITPLSTLTQLQWLDLDQTQVRDYSPLQYLTKLEELSLAYNNISSELAGILEKMPELKVLNLKGNSLGEATDASNVHTLAAVSSGVSNSLVLELAQLSQLHELDLSENGITSIQGLANLPQLTRLDVSNNQVSDISTLSTLPALQELNLSGNQISDLNPVRELSDITELDVSSNQISDLSPLTSLSQVSSLNLSDNQINNIEAVANLSSISTVYLSGNQVENYDAIAALPNLEEFSSDQENLSTGNWESKTGIEWNKSWQIRFNAPVKMNSVNSTNIYVKDQAGNRLPVGLNAGCDDCTVVVSPPAGYYQPGQSYYLYISDRVQSEEDTSLTQALKMRFTIAESTSAAQSELRHSPQGWLSNAFLVKDLVSFGYGLCSLVTRSDHDADYLRQLPPAHYIAVEMDNNLPESWRTDSPVYFGSVSILGTYNDLFGRNTYLGDTSASKFLNELNNLTLAISGAVGTKDCEWWATDLFRPVKEVAGALDFIGNWNKIRDGRVVLGRNLKIKGDKVFKVGSNENRLALTMTHKPKWEWKYLLGRPNLDIDVAQSEQALWVSGNPSVATVYKGQITGHKPGRATITVRYYNKVAKLDIQIK